MRRKLLDLLLTCAAAAAIGGLIGYAVHDRRSITTSCLNADGSTRMYDIQIQRENGQVQKQMIGPPCECVKQPEVGSICITPHK